VIPGELEVRRDEDVEPRRIAGSDEGVTSFSELVPTGGRD
jgi:hypothetical protein